jgi:hypothetical protein
MFSDTTGDLEWWWGGVVTPTGALDFTRTLKPPGVSRAGVGACHRATRSGISSRGGSIRRAGSAGGFSASRVARAYLGSDGQFGGSEAYNPCPERHGTARYRAFLVRTRTNHYWFGYPPGHELENLLA